MMIYSLIPVLSIYAGWRIQKFQCGLDGGAWTDCTSGVTYNDLQAAITHVFSVRAIDLSGNEDPTPATFAWKINPPKLK